MVDALLLVAQATKKSGIVWLAVPGQPLPVAAWHTWQTDATYVVTGPGEQPVPGLAEATGSARLASAMTEIQGAMTDLISYIAHPPEVLSSSNGQHRRLLAAVRERDAMRALQVMNEHLKGTEHVLAGLLPGG